jgi:RNA polymerase sigma factor (sigma-70 family)
VQALSTPLTTAEQDQRIADIIRREQARLRRFIQARVADAGDVDDILQDVFAELIEAYRLLKPIEEAGRWLVRVARNRIIDRFRKKRPIPFPLRHPTLSEHDDESVRWEDLLPSPDRGPEALYARGILLDELAAALGELPEDQRDAFLAHEVDGRSFKEISTDTGVGVNTLISRKHHAVVHLRERLRDIYREFQKEGTRIER